MSLSVETYALSKKFTNDSISGISGTLAGKNCTIQSITDIEGGHRVTFQWTADDSTTRTSTMDVMDGSGAEAIEQIYADNGVLGAKNLCPFNPATGTFGGITVSKDDSTQTITMNIPSATENNRWITISDPSDNLRSGRLLLPKGSYKLSAKVTGDTLTNTFKFGLSDTTGYLIASVGGPEPSSFTLDSDTPLCLGFRVPQGKTLFNFKLSEIMIRLASDPDDTYQPYTMTNRELTDTVTAKELKSTDDLNNLINEGAYKWGSSYPVNAPENTAFANMEVKSLTGIIVIQKVFRNGVIYTRTYNGAWGSWTKFTGTEVS